VEAFYKTDDFLLKVYAYDTDDWCVECIMREGSTSYWFSMWQANRGDSMLNAIEKTCEYVNIPFNKDNLVIY